MKTAHTPGPWRVREGALFKEGSREINPNLPHAVCPHCMKASPHPSPTSIDISAKGWGVASLRTYHPVEEFEQHMANARLIAAAPDLLKTLLRTMAALRANGAPNCEAMKEARAVLATLGLEE